MIRNVIATCGVAAVLASGACRSAAPVVQTPQASVSAQPATPVETLPDSLRWVRDSAEYRAAALQTYRAASAAIVAAASGRKPGSWAVVLDADETIISNLQYQIERAAVRLPYTPDSWRAWVARRAATPIPGAAAFLDRVHALGGRIAIVTNRLGSECPDTEAVFKTHKLTYDIMLCRQNGSLSDKNPRFAAVAAGTTPAGGPPVEILAFVGDNILDFPDLTQDTARQNQTALEPFASRFFLLPNPMYGSWQQ